MTDERTRAIAAVGSHAVQPAAATIPQDHSAPERTASSPQHATLPGRPPPVAARETELAFRPDPAAERVVVHVLDRETGSVLRSFPLVMPGGNGDGEAGRESPRGALVDAKA